jgi:hypothetical protein
MSVITSNKLEQTVETNIRGGTSVGVVIEDQLSDMLDIRFLEQKATGLTLANDTDPEARYVDLAPGHGLTDANSKGHVLEVASATTHRFIQTVILGITGDRVTIRQAVGQIFTVAGAMVGTGNPNMVKDAATGVVIDGSTTPVIFTLAPLPAQAGDISRIIFASTSGNTSDFSTFGGADALTIGMTLRHKRGDGSYKNIYTYTNNADMVLHGFDTLPDEPKATGNATYGRASKITFAGKTKHDVPVRLDGNYGGGEELQIVIYELMKNGGANGNDIIHFMAQGSELQGED